MAEFQKILDDPEKLEQMNKAIFDQIDTDGSGQIDQSELGKAMSLIAEQAEIPAPSEDDVKKAVAELDTDNSGKISATEFKELVKQILSVMANS
mmetsp:Transcript_10027/g.10343  ORF Transcript_10027/g.10343 Transcript_10027/m.10343 type:complete len:94 (+) Transcript_10027:12-293(+)